MYFIIIKYCYVVILYMYKKNLMNFYRVKNKDLRF